MSLISQTAFVLFEIKNPGAEIGPDTVYTKSVDYAAHFASLVIFVAATFLFTHVAIY